MSNLDEDVIRAALAKIDDPQSGKDIVSSGLVSRPVIRGGAVTFAIDTADRDAQQMENLRRIAQDAVRALDGVTEVTAVLTADRPPAAPPAAKETEPLKVQIGGHPDPNKNAADMLAQVDNVIAVASGKGGVGKSTTAVNLAVSLQAAGYKTGLLDADIHGPSLPRMLGVEGPPKSTDDKKIVPMQKFGLELMSIGFMIDPETPMIWRGPMVMGALEQLMRDVEWGSSQDTNRLEILVVDMPPGTGDVALTLSQRVDLAGAVIVSTPQDIALIDAVKAVNMFRKVNVPILGIIENMSHFSCPNCGTRSDIFGHGGAAREAERLGCDFLGEISLDLVIRETGDQGRPVAASDPDGPHGRVFSALADIIAGKLGLRN